MSIYFGGSRHLPQSGGNLALIKAVVSSVISGGQLVHVGCQKGADQAVISITPATSLRVFCVYPQPSAPVHVLACPHVVYSAGGQSAPMPARFLLRSIAAFQGCSQAVFFSPGAGSLAVARECVRSGLQVFAFQQSAPAPIPSASGHWVTSSFMGFSCWQWSAPTQPTLF